MADTALWTSGLVLIGLCFTNAFGQLSILTDEVWPDISDDFKEDGYTFQKLSDNGMRFSINEINTEKDDPPPFKDVNIDYSNSIEPIQSQHLKRASNLGSRMCRLDSRNCGAFNLGKKFGQLSWLRSDDYKRRKWEFLMANRRQKDGDSFQFPFERKRQWIWNTKKR